MLRNAPAQRNDRCIKAHDPDGPAIGRPKSGRRATLSPGLDWRDVLLRAHKSRIAFPDWIGTLALLDETPKRCHRVLRTDPCNNPTSRSPLAQQKVPYAALSMGTAGTNE
jgi:hypothetical protein